MRERRQVDLANSLPDDDLVRRLAGLAKVFGKLKQGASDACLEREKAHGRRLLVSLPQAPRGRLPRDCRSWDRLEGIRGRCRGSERSTCCLSALGPWRTLAARRSLQVRRQWLPVPG